LEGQRRDPDAERLIREGLGRAPNAIYALVQSVRSRTRPSSAPAPASRSSNAPPAAPNPPRAAAVFSTTCAASSWERDQARGSVPSSDRAAKARARVGHAARATSPAPYPPGGQMAAPRRWRMMGGGMMGAQAPGHGGGSFLARRPQRSPASFGGAMLLNGIRSMMADISPLRAIMTAPAHHTHLRLGDSDRGGKRRSSRDAGLNDIGGQRSAANDGPGRSSGFFGGTDDDQPESAARRHRRRGFRRRRRFRYSVIA